MQKLRRVYLDYAATTPVDSEVVRAMLPHWTKRFGNPGSLHSFGQEAQAAVDESRAGIARFLGCQPKEVIFTGSATEANNLAIRGTVEGVWSGGYGVGGKGYRENGKPVALPHIVTSAIEHESVLETCGDLEKSGQAEVTYVPVDRRGIIKLDVLEAALRPETVLVSVMYANNEIGTIQPLPAISKIIRNFRNSKHEIRNPKSETKPNYQIAKLPNYPIFHTDAVQAVQFLDCDVGKLGVDLMTISAHKIYGPKGIGALYLGSKEYGVRSREYGVGSREYGVGALRPVITGGGQEHGLRSGTENVPYIAGFAKAIELVQLNRAKSARKIKILRETLRRGIMRFAPTARINSPDSGLPNILNVSFPGVRGEDLLFGLDLAGIAVSTGSACKAKSSQPSHVLKAIDLEEELIGGSIRISLGRPTTHQEIARALRALEKILAEQMSN